MMAPANSLLWTAAMAGFAAAALGAFVPASGLAVLVALLALAVLAAWDAAASVRRLHAVQVGFQPEDGTPLRMTRDRDGVLTLRFEHSTRRPLALRVGIQFPPGLDSPAAVQEVLLQPGAPVAELHWPCVPRERGRFEIVALHLETPSRLGWWLLRHHRAARAVIAAYPNIERERNRVAALFLRRGGVGMHAQRQVGKGREFEQLREYIPGDAPEDIHWKATARRAMPITKVFRVERTQEVYAVIDAGRFSARGAGDGPDTQLELAMNAALVLGMVAERQGDRFGLAVFSDRLDTLVPAGHGHAHYQACREALYTLQPRMAHPDFGEVFTSLRLRLRRRALLLFLTHLDDALLAESFAQHAPLLARRHLVGVFPVTPPGVRPLFSVPVAQPGEIYDHLAGHLRWQEQAELQRELHRQGITMRPVAHAALTPEIVGHYLAVKRRQLL